MTSVNTCPLCQSAIEALAHAFCDCSRVAEVWSLVCRGPVFLSSWNLEFHSWLLLNLTSRKAVDGILWCQTFGATLDRIWWRRNECTFRQANVSALETWRKAVAYAREIQRASKMNMMLSDYVLHKPLNREVCWTPPPPGMLKLNCDAALSSSKAACGGAFRDEHGRFMVGFATSLNISNFHHLKPYNLPVSKRYSFKDGIHKLWVYPTDKPLSPGSKTKPRSEIRIEGYDYSSGVWQFEGQGFVPKGTSGVCIMQVFGAHPKRATTFMLDVYNNSLVYYNNPVLVPNIWNRWFQLNVIHDVEASNVKIYVDRVRVYEAPGEGGSSHFFKFGVYTQDDPSSYMESRWKEIRVLRKSS